MPKRHATIFIETPDKIFTQGITGDENYFQKCVDSIIATGYEKHDGDNSVYYPAHQILKVRITRLGEVE